MSIRVSACTRIPNMCSLIAPLMALEFRYAGDEDWPDDVVVASTPKLERGAVAQEHGAWRGVTRAWYDMAMSTSR